MAKLEDLGVQLGVKIKPTTSEKSKGKKRRSWLGESGEEPVSKEIANGQQTVSKEIANGQQTVSKEIANGQQTVSKEIANSQQTVSKEIANSQQTVSKEIANSQQTVSKEIANGQQTVSKEIANSQQTVSKEIANSQQTVSKEIANSQQTVSKEIANSQQTVSKEIANGQQTVSKEIANSQQTVSKEIANSQQIQSSLKENSLFNSYIGRQKDLIEFLFSTCISKSRITRKIAIQDIQNAIGTTFGTIKQAIYRVKLKGGLSIHERKNGRGGWCIYEIDKELFLDVEKYLKKEKSSIYNSNIITIDKNKDSKGNPEAPKNIVEQPRSKMEQILETIPEPILEVQAEPESDPWYDVDMTPLESHGFKKTHIGQIKGVEGITPDDLQSAINHYAWALENDPERMQKYAPKSNPLRGLIGSLKKGFVWTEAKYIDPHEEAMDLALAAKKERLERIKAKKEEMIGIEFELWREELTDTDIATINKKMKCPKSSGRMYEAAIKAHFKEHVYKK